MKGSKSLKTSLTISFISVAVFPILVSGLIAIYSLSVSMEQGIAAKNQVLAKSLAAEIDRFLGQHLRVLQQVKQMQVKTSFISPDKFDDYLAFLIEEYTLFDSILILDGAGIVAHMAPFDENIFGVEMIYQDFYKKAKNQNRPYWSQTSILPQTGQPTITLALPFETGMVVGHLNLSELNVITDKVKIDSNGYAAVADRDATIIAHRNTKFVTERLNVKNLPPVRQGMTGIEGSANYHFRGVEEIGSVAIVAQTHWVVVVTQPLSEAFAPVKRVQRAVLFGILVAVIIAVIAALLSLRKTLDPLIQLTQDSKRIASGDYAYQPGPASYREVDLLRSGIKSIVAAVETRENELRKNRDRLEDMVAERTAAFEEAKAKAEATNQAKEALLESEARLSKTTENVPGMIYQFLLRPDGSFCLPYASAWCQSMFGIQPETLREDGSALVDLIPAEDRPGFDASVTRSAQTMEPWRWEGRILAVNGEVVWHQGISKPERQPDGSVLWSGIFFDVTERKRAEESLKQSELTYREIFNTANDTIWIHDLETFEFLDVNDKVKEMFGYSVQEALKLSLEDISSGVPPFVQETAVSYLKKASSGEQQLFEWHTKHKDGHLFWSEVNLRRGSIGGRECILAVERDITDRHRIQSALRESERLFRAVFEQAPYFIGVLDLKGTVLQVNQTAADFAGVEREDCHGRPFWETPWWQHSQEEQARLKDGIRRASRGEFIRFETTHPTPVGELRFIDFALKPVRDESGAVVVLVPQGQDVTERKEAEAQLLRLNQELEARVTARTAELAAAKEAAEVANKSKSSFLANMSHELRSPLNTVLGFSNLLLRDATAGNDALSLLQQERLSIVHRSGEHLLTLINDVLELSRIEAGGISVETNPCDLPGLLNGIKDMFSLKAREKNLGLAFELGSNLPQAVSTDAVKLRQVLVNLVSNAVKFTEKGEVTVRAGIRASENAGADGTRVTLIFEISDTGVGIAPEEQGVLFDAFAQTHSGRARQEGTGLGLAISKQFVTLLGGEIAVDSRPGKGSTFAFEIPVDVVEAPAGDTEPDDRRIIGMAPGQPAYRILVVDDIADSRKLLLDLLEPLGFELREANNGKEAIEKWKAFAPHLIWMDMRMPVMSGYEATKRIKESLGGDTIKILALTASSFEDERARILDAGCDDFIRKPIREKDLLEMMDRHLDIKWVYDDSGEGDRRKQQKPDMPGLDLASIPTELRDRIETACIRTDMNKMVEFIEQVRRHDQDTAEALALLAARFDYQTIVAMIRKSRFGE